MPAGWAVRELLPLRDGSTLFVLHHPARVTWLPDSSSVVRMPSRIVIGAREREDGSLELLDRTHRELVQVSAPPNPTVIGTLVEGLNSLQARIGFVNNMILVGELPPPFKVFGLVEGRWKEVAPAVESPEMSPLSTALDIVDLDGLGLQTLADQTSRRRILRLFSPHTGGGHEKEIVAPLALIAIAPDRRIVGVRSVSGDEFVRYSWQWR